MNFLFHLYLSGSDPDLLTGNLMGDFVKGRLELIYPERLRPGVRLHRGIDSFAQQNLLFRRSRERIAPSLGLWRGVLVDLYYDHFLALEWQEWSAVPYGEYLEWAAAVLEDNCRQLPQRLQEVLPRMFGEWLPAYAEIGGIARALERMGQRVRRPNPLAGGESELVRNYAGLREDFRCFTPQVRDFAEEFQSRSLSDR